MKRNTQEHEVPNSRYGSKKEIKRTII